MKTQLKISSTLVCVTRTCVLRNRVYASICLLVVNVMMVLVYLSCIKDNRISGHKVMYQVPLSCFKLQQHPGRPSRVLRSPCFILKQHEVVSVSHVSLCDCLPRGIDVLAGSPPCRQLAMG